ncbi:hypothetical protein ACFO5O_11910 [Geojedonia litorea]|uniref:Toxin-antitoxin system protein n=1 Tax=Geojedonia litorea TaxID=1268269 RepID=A0ABV9N608_9FLAO
MSKEKQTKTKTIRLDESLIEKLETLAKKDNRNFNNYIETILIREARTSALNRI